MSRTRSRSVLASPPDDVDERAEERADRQVRSRREGHRLRRGPGGADDRTDQRAHQTPAHPRQGPSLAPRAADAGRQAAPDAALPRALRPRALPGSRRRPRPASMIGVVEKAPDFILRNEDGEDVSLADYAGRKVMIVFYPFDFSAVCTDQLASYQEIKPQLGEKN